MQRTLVDARARERIRHDHDSTLIVEAAAGTGKTTELVQRILGLLLSGKATLSRIVSVTFTEKAAGEMKLRLRTEIERARNATSISAAERARLEKALEELETSKISTIHGFCADLLREWAVEARVDPLFEVAAEGVRDRLYGDAFDRWFEEQLEHPGDGVRRLLRRRSRDRDAVGPRQSLYRSGLDLIDQRDFDARYRCDPFDREQAFNDLLERLAQLGAYASRADWKESYLTQNLLKVRRFTEELARREAIRGRDYDGLEADLRTLARDSSWKWKGGGKWFCKEVLRTTVVEERDALKAKLERTLDLADAHLAACLQHDLFPLVTRYTSLKTKAGKLDFLDLLLLTRDLLRDDREVRNELQERFSHLLVDEFQDTDPLQAEILLLLSADDPEASDHQTICPAAGKLFAVGDPKQSIYRFRRADVAFYESIKERLTAKGAEVLHLTTSFRSVPSIQQAVNAAFSTFMHKGALNNESGPPYGKTQPEYVPLAPYRDEPGTFPTVIALPIPRPYADYGKIADYKIEESCPDVVGAFVEWLVKKSGLQVSERESPGKLLPVAPRHICLLFKRFQKGDVDMTRGYVRALEARHIPHVLVGGRSFYEREEVIAVCNALSALEWGDDEFSLYATLRGPFFGIGDDALLAFRHQFHRLSLYSTYADAELSELTRTEVMPALSLLRNLSTQRNRRPIADTLSELLEATRAHAGIAIWPTGEQALANVLRIIDLARKFESTEVTSFRSFVYHLETEAMKGGVSEAPVVEEGTDGVRMMTVHRAKGLEFPVVVLVDPTARVTSNRPSRYVDPARGLWAMPMAGCAPIELLERRDEVLAQDWDEAVRLTYVAATRARELLVVPVVGDNGPADARNEDAKWLDVLHQVLYPRPDERRTPREAPGCPPFGEDSVFERPTKSELGATQSVRPGLHRPLAGEHQVVFWDPKVLRLDVEDEAGLRQQRILEADEKHHADETAERAHRQWASAREELLTRGARPSARVVTPTQLKDALSPETASSSTKQAAERSPDPMTSGESSHAPPTQGEPSLSPAELISEASLASITLAHTSRPRGDGPAGKRFGVLVHAVLATVPLDADASRIHSITVAQARLLGASNAEITGAEHAVTAALAHPLLTAAAQSTSCRREVPLRFAREGDTLVEGVLDLCFREPAGWVVVDFKTDVELSRRERSYRVQTALYVEGVARVTGEPVRGVLLSV